MKQVKRNLEFYLSIFYSLNIRHLEEQLGIELQELELEKSLGNRRVDLYAETNNGREVYVEYQIKEADSQHAQQIADLITSNEVGNNIVIVWIAKSFKQEDFKEIIDILEQTRKQIIFKALTLKSEVLLMLEELRNIHPLKVVDELQKLDDIDSHLEPVYVLDNTETTEEQIDDDECKKKILEYSIIEMKQQLRYYIPIYRSKRIVGNRITIGSGVSDIVYNIGINKQNMMYVQLSFAENKEEIYRQLKIMSEKINEALDYRVEWEDNNRKIVTYINMRGQIERCVKEGVRVLDKYIRCFYDYLQYEV